MINTDGRKAAHELHLQRATLKNIVQVGYVFARNYEFSGWIHGSGRMFFQGRK